MYQQLVSITATHANLLGQRQTKHVVVALEVMRMVFEDFT